MSGNLGLDALERSIQQDEIDTILCVFVDLQGRFMGKRVTGDFFLHEVLGEEGLHACLYLVTVDMEMEPLPGYEYANWETGYGDFRMVPEEGCPPRPEPLRELVPLSHTEHPTEQAEV